MLASTLRKGFGVTPNTLCLRCTPSRAASQYTFTATSGLPSMQVAAASNVQGAGTLSATADHYGGMIIQPESLPSDPHVFQATLQHSLQEWQSQGKHGIWLKIPIHLSALIAPAAEHCGFKFHHAEEDYVMMTRWLPERPNTLPPNASHQVGVGAFVVNEHQEMLVVQEKNGPLKGQAVWKMPTGLVQQGEDIVQAAEREVLEETGVRAPFSALLAIRQAHGFAFGKSDMFFCCGLIPEPGQTQLTACDREIEAVRWMPLQEYKQQFFMKDSPLYATMLDRCYAWAEGRYKGMKGHRLGSALSRPREDLLLWGDDDSCSNGQPMSDNKL
eukprot:jgi/Chrzof1/13792/Cz08g12180.t1